VIAISFALPSESSALVSLIDDRTQVKRDTYHFIRGTIAGCEAAVLHSGVGVKVAAPRVAAFIETEKPHLFIGAGFAGATRDDFRPGDVIVGENFSDPDLVSKAMACLQAYQPRTVVLLTSESIVDSPAERSAIGFAHGADAVDMETSAIAAACRARGIPLLSLRAISDTVAQPFPAPPPVLFDLEQQQTNLRVLLPYLLGHPRAIPSLIAFARRVGHARKRLAHAIATVLPHL
jgi:adenosylhomocysteine nucleosidase